MCCSHQTGRWTPASTVATFPGHNYLQLTQIEFHDRGLNPVLLSQWIKKSTALNIRPQGTPYTMRLRHLKHYDKALTDVIQIELPNKQSGQISFLEYM